MESKKHDRDVGLILGARITSWYRRTFNRPHKEKKLSSEREPLLGQPKLTCDEENDLVLSDATIRERPPRMMEVLSPQTTLNLVVYALLAMYSIAYDQVSRASPLPINPYD